MVRRDIDAESRVVPAFEGPSGDPEERREMVRFVAFDREVGKPVLVEIRDGQVHRILAGGTGPRYLEAAVALAGQHEDAFAAGNHEVQPPVAIQVVSLDRGGGQGRSLSAVVGDERHWISYVNYTFHHVVFSLH